MEENKKTFPEIVKSQKKVVKIGIVTVIALIVVIVIAVSAGGNKNKAQNTVSQTVTTTAPAPTTENNTNKAVGTVGSVTTTSAPESENVSETVKKDEGIPEIKLGQTISTEDYDFTLNKVELSYRVEPDYKPSYYHYYDAPENEIYVYVNASIKNKKKMSVDCDTIYTATVDYNDGYTYDGFHIADDYDGDFTYANITDIDPLQTLGVHSLISCPEEVETSDAPLFVTIKIRGGEKYKYTIR